MTQISLLIYEEIAHFVIDFSLFLLFYILKAFVYTVDWFWDAFYRIMK